MNQKKCRHCLRQLVAADPTPVEAVAHCATRGCVWCGECARGETSVSPLAAPTVVPALADLRRIPLDLRTDES